MQVTDHESEIVEVFRRNVQKRIDSQHLNVSDLCRRAKVNRAGFYSFLDGDGGITLAKAGNLAKAMGTTLDELLKNEN